MVSRISEYLDEPEVDDMQEWSDNFDSTQYVRDMAFWSGLSLCIGIFIGMAIMAQIT